MEEVGSSNLPVPTTHASPDAFENKQAVFRSDRHWRKHATK